jgi:hypothetical protein
MSTVKQIEQEASVSQHQPLAANALVTKMTEMQIKNLEEIARILSQLICKLVKLIENQ